MKHINIDTFLTILKGWINDEINNYVINRRTDKFDFIKCMWDELEKRLKEEEFDEETFKALNVRYRKRIEDQFYSNKYVH